MNDGQQLAGAGPAAVAPGEAQTSSVKAMAKSQPLLALSGLGVALSGMKSAMRKIKQVSRINLIKLPKFYKFLPRYMRHNYVKYPALFIVLLAAVRRTRLMLAQ